MGRPGRATRPPGTDPEERWLPMTILDHDKSKWVRREIRCIYTGDDVKMNLRIRWRSVAPRGRPCARLRLRPRRSPPCATCLPTVQCRGGSALLSGGFEEISGENSIKHSILMFGTKGPTQQKTDRTEQQRKIMRSRRSGERRQQRGGSRVAVVESSRSFLSGSLSLCLTHSYIAASLVQLRTASHHRVGLFSAVHPSQSGILQCCHKKEFPCL